MKKYILIIGVVLAAFVVTNNLTSCATTEKITAKTGTQLWGENCIRCHNAPSSTRYSDNDWAVILTHMRVTANLTADEEVKIREYLKSAN